MGRGGRLFEGGRRWNMLMELCEMRPEPSATIVGRDERVLQTRGSSRRNESHRTRKKHPRAERRGTRSDVDSEGDAPLRGATDGGFPRARAARLGPRFSALGSRLGSRCSCPRPPPRLRRHDTTEEVAVRGGRLRARRQRASRSKARSCRRCPGRRASDLRRSSPPGRSLAGRLVWLRYAQQRSNKAAFLVLLLVVRAGIPAFWAYLRGNSRENT